MGAPAQTLIFKKSRDAQNTVCAPMLNFMLGDRHIRKMAARPLHARYGHVDEPRAAGGLKVAFYPGCMGDKMYVDMAEACLKALRHHKVAVLSLIHIYQIADITRDPEHGEILESASSRTAARVTELTGLDFDRFTRCV